MSGTYVSDLVTSKGSELRTAHNKDGAEAAASHVTALNPRWC